MYIEIHDHLGNPVRLPATRVVVYDDHGNPISLTVQHNPAWLQSCHVGERRFPELLEQLGVHRSVIVTRQDLKKLVPPAVK
jgi:hypothetical protein